MDGATVALDGLQEEEQHLSTAVVSTEQLSHEDSVSIDDEQFAGFVEIVWDGKFNNFLSSFGNKMSEEEEEEEEEEEVEVDVLDTSLSSDLVSLVTWESVTVSSGETSV